MPKISTLILMAGFASASILGVAQDTTPKVKTVPVQPTSPTSGQEMYAAYCAACHGAKATGDGPAAQALKTAPPDLTVLSQKNGGAFPADRVRTVLQFGVMTPAHGSAEMPVWGDLLRTLHSTTPNTNMVVNQRIINLTNYIKQIQK
jgi:mono/diheme cytochrome c family protein